MESKKEYKKIVFLIAIIAALGGLLFGLDQGFIANAGHTLDHVYGMECNHMTCYGGSVYVGPMSVKARL